MPTPTLDRQQLRRVTEGLVALPTLPLVASRLLEAIADPDTYSEQIARIVALDPALTARTLRLANSDFYGFPRKVGSVDLAVVVLGAPTVRDLVLSAAVFQTIGAAGADLTALWNHSMATGVAARALADRAGYRLAGEAYAAGVLHDIGKVVLRQSFPDRFEGILALAREQRLSIAEAERGVLGSDHAEVGGWLAERWGLPADLVEAIACHHRPDRAVVNPELVDLVHLANALAERMGHAWPQGAEPHPVDPDAWQRIEPDESRREAFLAALVPHLNRAMEGERALFSQFRGSEEERP
ncbi:MAG TPA: HDOD domain-containing protein [Candidatus Eisenbacteria bacterium]|jgi:putative nucleotidyltransferase with HDIG domain